MNNSNNALKKPESNVSSFAHAKFKNEMRDIFKDKKLFKNTIRDSASIKRDWAN